MPLLKRGDQQGMEELYRIYSPLIYGLILRIIGREDVAQEALQDTFLKIWNNIQAYNPDKGRFIPWVLKIARNTAIDTKRLKREKQQRQIVSFSEELKTSRTLSTELPIDHIGLRDQVKQLEPAYQKVIELAFFCGMTHTEVAEELNLPLGTVKGRIRKAFRELRIIFS